MYTKKYLQQTLKYSLTKPQGGVSPFMITKTAKMFTASKVLNGPLN
jgi:hypothetical protein